MKNVYYYMKSNNKQLIMDATFTLSLKHGFDNVSIKQIQEEAGVSPGTIYYYFKSKDEILEYMLNKYIMDSFHQFKEKVKEFDGSFNERLNFIFRYESGNLVTKEEGFPYGLARPKITYKDYFILITSIHHRYREFSTGHKLHNEIFNFCHELVEEAVEKNEIRDDIDIKKIAVFIHTTLKGYIGLLVYQPEVTIDELVEYNMELIWEAIKK